MAINKSSIINAVQFPWWSTVACGLNLLEPRMMFRARGIRLLSWNRLCNNLPFEWWWSDNFGSSLYSLGGHLKSELYVKLIAVINGRDEIYIPGMKSFEATVYVFLNCNFGAYYHGRHSSIQCIDSTTTNTIATTGGLIKQTSHCETQ